jgi:RND family efflux transporter MFP subunit
MLRKWLTIPLAMLCLLGLSGCFLLPAEPEVPELPLVTPYSGAEYVTAQVTRGDLTLVQTINCTFSATRKQDLKFTVADRPYGEILVVVGQEVKAGDLIAELESAEVKNRLKQVADEVTRLELQQACAEKELALALEQEKLRKSDNTAASDARAADLEYYQASLEIKRKKLDELASELESLRLYAGIDGTVSYVKNLKDGEMSSRADLIATITDTSSSVFTASTDAYEWLPVGTEVSVKSGDTEYPCRVVSAASRGLEDKVDNRGNRTIYLEIIGPETPTGDSTKGTVELLLDSREDVLILPKRAVFTVGDQYYVYYEDENGLKTAKGVSCGLEAGWYIEVTGGLSEGDTVILS